MITTERLYLKPTSIEDSSFLFELMNSEKWLLNIGDRHIKSPEDASAIVTQRIAPQFERLGYGCHTVVNRETGEKMGTCGIYERPGLDIPDIGFAFLPPYEGKGYGTESATAILKDAMENFGLKKVCAITLESNIPSQKLLTKLGLSYSRMVTLPDDTQELMLFTN